MLRQSVLCPALCGLVLALSACASNPQRGPEHGLADGLEGGSEHRPAHSVVRDAANSAGHSRKRGADGVQDVNSRPADAIAAAELGSIVQLSAGNPLGVSRVRVQDEYRAASGRLCRRVQLPRNSDSIRVMCERGNGQWSFTRTLASSTVNERITPGSQ